MFISSLPELIFSFTATAEHICHVGAAQTYDAEEYHHIKTSLWKRKEHCVFEPQGNRWIALMHQQSHIKAISRKKVEKISVWTAAIEMRRAPRADMEKMQRSLLAMSTNRMRADIDLVAYNFMKVYIVDMESA